MNSVYIDPFTTMATALAYLSLTDEKDMEKADAPGVFMIAFHYALDKIYKDQLEKLSKIYKIHMSFLPKYDILMPQTIFHLRHHAKNIYLLFQALSGRHSSQPPHCICPVS